mgnify:CR=1 FL=1
MDFNSLLETAKKMGETASNQQKELENKSFNFSCQNNLITGKINGKYQITELHISQDLMDDKDYKKYIIDIKRFVRNSIEYKRLREYLKNYVDMDKCAVYENVTMRTKLTCP